MYLPDKGAHISHSACKKALPPAFPASPHPPQHLEHSRRRPIVVADVDAGFQRIQTLLLHQRGHLLRQICECKDMCVIDVMVPRMCGLNGACWGKWSANHLANASPTMQGEVRREEEPLGVWVVCIVVLHIPNPRPVQQVTASERKTVDGASVWGLVCQVFILVPSSAPHTYLPTQTLHELVTFSLGHTKSRHNNDLIECGLVKNNVRGRRGSLGRHGLAPCVGQY